MRARGMFWGAPLTIAAVVAACGGAMRADFVAAGLVEERDAAKHRSTLYAEIPRG